MGENEHFSRRAALALFPRGGISHCCFSESFFFLISFFLMRFFLLDRAVRALVRRAQGSSHQKHAVAVSRSEPCWRTSPLLTAAMPLPRPKAPEGDGVKEKMPCYELEIFLLGFRWKCLKQAHHYRSSSPNPNPLPA